MSHRNSHIRDTSPLAENHLLSSSENSRYEPLHHADIVRAEMQGIRHLNSSYSQVQMCSSTQARMPFRLSRCALVAGAHAG